MSTRVPLIPQDVILDAMRANPQREGEAPSSWMERIRVAAEAQHGASGSTVLPREEE